jgi:hypothetical protein
MKVTNNITLHPRVKTHQRLALMNLGCSWQPKLVKQALCYFISDKINLNSSRKSPDLLNYSSKLQLFTFLQKHFKSIRNLHVLVWTVEIFCCLCFVCFFLVPAEIWQKSRRLVSTQVMNESISVRFVRYENRFVCLFWENRAPKEHYYFHHLRFHFKTLTCAICVDSMFWQL